MTTTPLRFEIIAMLAVKLLVIFILWKLCFSHPIDQNLAARDIQQHFEPTNSFITVHKDPHHD